MIGVLSDWVPLISTVLVCLIGAGGLVAIYKARDERDAIIVGSAKNIVDASNDLVVVQRQELTDLRAEMAAMEVRLQEAETYQVRVRELERELENARLEAQALAVVRDALSQRVEELQAEVAALRSEVHGNGS